MCAAVAVIPVVVTLPLTDLSAPTVIEPLPDAPLFTGGTSSSPDNVRTLSGVTATLSCVPNVPNKTMRAALMTSTTALNVLIAFSCIGPARGTGTLILQGCARNSGSGHTYRHARGYRALNIPPCSSFPQAHNLR